MRTHRTIPLTLLFAIIWLTASMKALGSMGDAGNPVPFASPDSTRAVDVHDTSPDIIRGNLSMGLGQLFLTRGWEPGYPSMSISLNVIANSRDTPLWGDLGLLVGWAGRHVDYHSVPSSSTVGFQVGVGDRWFLKPLSTQLQLSFYVTAGPTYVWADLEEYDLTRPPARITEDIGSYPVVQAFGHFWGGYARCGVILRIGDSYCIGLGLLGMVTTSRNLMGRQLNMNSTGIALTFGEDADVIRH